MNYNKWIIGAIVLLLAIALGFIGGLYLKKPVTVTNPIPVYIQGKDSIVIEKHYYAIHDTVEAVVTDTIVAGNFYNEKVFDKDTIKINTTVKYNIPNSNFSFYQYVDLTHAKEMRIDTIKIDIPVEKVVYKDVPFYKEPFFVFLVGLLSGIAILLFGGG